MFLVEHMTVAGSTVPACGWWISAPLVKCLGKPVRIYDEHAPAECFDILAGSGGDILFPQVEVLFFYPCYTFEQGKPARICDEYAPAECFGILAGSGGDILFPAGRGPLLLSLRRQSVCAAWGLYLMRVHC